MFTARRWDLGANLYYYRFRDYQPDLGRFCQPDPLHYIDGMNLYAYCGNSPINWIDPWGLNPDIMRSEKFMELVGGPLIVPRSPHPFYPGDLEWWRTRGALMVGEKIALTKGGGFAKALHSGVKIYQKREIGVKEVALDYVEDVLDEVTEGKAGKMIDAYKLLKPDPDPAESEQTTKSSPEQ